MYATDEALDSTTSKAKVDDNIVLGDQDDDRNKLHQKINDEKGHPNPSQQVCSAHAALEWMARQKHAEDNARQSSDEPPLTDCDRQK